MEYVTVSARFLFFNGQKRYTVEYHYGINHWYVFNEGETTNCVYDKPNKKVKWVNINLALAGGILSEYLEPVATVDK